MSQKIQQNKKVIKRNRINSANLESCRKETI